MCCVVHPPALDQAPMPKISTIDSDAWLAALVESSSDAIISKSLEGIVTSWNASAERIFGYSASEMVGQSMVEKLLAGSRPFKAGGECELRLPAPARPLWRDSKFKQQSARWVAPGTSFSSHLEITW